MQSKLQENVQINNFTSNKDTKSQYKVFKATTGHGLVEKEDADFYQIDLNEPLNPGEEYTLYMEFITRISNTTLDGLYLSKYVDPETKKEKYFIII